MRIPLLTLWLAALLSQPLAFTATTTVEGPGKERPANTVLAGPTTGGDALPTYRALVAADLPTMVGDSGAGGTKGAVPAPSAGDAAANKFLNASGSWATLPAAGVPTSRQIIAGSGLTGGGDLTADRTLSMANGGTTLAFLESRARPQINYLINGGFNFWQRSTNAAVVDWTGTFSAADRWYSLGGGVATSGGGVLSANNSFSRVASTDGEQYDALVRRRDYTNYRYAHGLAQIVESANSIPLRGRSVIAQARVKGDTANNLSVRIAIVEWSGTADAPNKGLVADWTSSNYTLGNFFVATNFAAVSVSSPVTVTNAAYQTVSVSTTINAATNNIAVFVWGTEDAINAQAALVMTKAGLYDGTQLRDWLPRPIGEERQLCLRYYWRVGSGVMLGSGCYYNISQGLINIRLPVTMRITPNYLSLSGSAYNGVDGQAITAYQFNGYDDPDNVQIFFTTANVPAALRPAWLYTAVSGHFAIGAEF